MLDMVGIASIVSFDFHPKYLQSHHLLQKQMFADVYKIEYEQNGWIIDFIHGMICKCINWINDFRPII